MFEINCAHHPTTIMQNASKPDFVYKLVPATPPIPDILPKRLPVSSIDETSGFVHLSTANQILGTLNTFFEEHEGIYVLRLSYEKIVANVRWEDPEINVRGPRDERGNFSGQTIHA